MCHWSITESDARQHGIYLFYLKILQHDPKAGFCPLWRRRKKPIWRNLLAIQDEAISLVTMRSKELWLVEENHATVKPDLSVALRWMRTYSESRIELRNPQILKKMLEKSSQFFVFGAALWAEKLWRCLENCWSWKKLVVVVNLEAIWFEFWMKQA